MTCFSAEVCDPCLADTYKSATGNQACTSCSDLPEFGITGMLYSSTQGQTGSVSIFLRRKREPRRHLGGARVLWAELLGEIDPDEWMVSKLNTPASFSCHNFMNYVHNFRQIFEEFDKVKKSSYKSEELASKSRREWLKENGCPQEKVRWFG